MDRIIAFRVLLNGYPIYDCRLSEGEITTEELRRIIRLIAVIIENRGEKV